MNEPAEPYGVAKFVQGDVRSGDDLRRALGEGVDTVINLAAVHFDYGHEPEEYFETNETGMQTLRGIVAADFTGDGLPDIAAAAPLDAKLALLVNRGGTFDPPREIDTWDPYEGEVRVWQA